MRKLAHDLPASFVVFLVAVPLSLGIALACNAPLASGLLGAIVGGIIVGALAGAPLQVSGPGNGITGIVFGFMATYGGDWRAVCAITVMAGLVQILLGSVRAARVALAISPAVVHGMLAAIGIQLALGQLHIVLGGAPQSSALANLRELPRQILDLHGAATLLGLLTIGILFAWRLLPDRVRMVPAPLVALVVATVASLRLDSVPRVSLGFEGGGIFSSIALPRWPEASAWTIAGSVVALALITSVESLLSAVGTDKLHEGERANLDKELVAQGVGNTVSGLIGGLPIAGVIVRSTTNIASGGRTRWASILHGVWVLVFTTACAWILESIPKSVLAGLLVFVGVNLVSFARARELVRANELPAYLATIFGVVFLDLLRGVGIGIAVAVALLAWRAVHFVVSKRTTPDGGSEVRLKGALSFLGVPRLLDALESIPTGTRVVLDTSALAFVDHAGLEAIEGWRSAHVRRGGTVETVTSASAAESAEAPPKEGREDPTRTPEEAVT